MDIQQQPGTTKTGASISTSFPTLPAGTVEAIISGNPFPGDHIFEAMAHHLGATGRLFRPEAGVEKALETLFMKFHGAHLSILLDRDLWVRDQRVMLRDAREQLPLTVASSCLDDSRNISDVAQQFSRCADQRIISAIESSLEGKCCSQSANLSRHAQTAAQSMSTFFDNERHDPPREKFNIMLALTYATRDVFVHHNAAATFAEHFIEFQLKELQDAWKSLESKGICESGEGMEEFRRALKSKIVELFA